MTMQSTPLTESNVPPVRKSTSDGRPALDTIDSAAPELKVKIRQYFEDGKSRVSAWKSGVQDGIREKPIQTVLIAAAVGAVIGVILGRRSR
jgi:ElaB/YqjD/DUF883 family membrane-anchored ribosome-binding protein